MIGSLPEVWINVAVTADGKIAPDSRKFVPFSTPLDHERMMELRSQSDAVLCGARTVDLAKVDLGPGGRKYERKRLEEGRSRFNLRVIVSGEASLRPNAHIFTQRFSPILLITRESAPVRKRRRLEALVDDIFVSPGSAIDFRAALKWLGSKWGVKRLLCEGGGEINAALLMEGLVRKLHLTICPVIFGGRRAPTLADGAGILKLTEAARFKLSSRELIGQELYCVYSR